MSSWSPKASEQTILAARLDTLYALYRDRIAYFRLNPPPPNWDGAAEALSK